MANRWYGRQVMHLYACAYWRMKVCVREEGGGGIEIEKGRGNEIEIDR